MPSKLQEARFLRVLIPEDYDGPNGDKRTNWHEVGRAWLQKTKAGDEYISMTIPAGIAISGKVQLRAATTREEREPETRNEPRREPEGKLPRGRR